MPDIERVLSELKESKVIVEGKKDARALEGLGVQDVMPLNGRPLNEIARELECCGTGKKDVVILTDFDAEGKRLYSSLLSLLQRHRIRTNPRLRKMFREIGKTRIEDFAGISSDTGMNKKIRGDSYGETGASVYKVPDKGKDKGERRYREA